jgi:hypothetical protein
MKKLIKAGLIIGAVALVAGVAGGIYMFGKKHKDLSVTKPDFIIQADALLKEFETNEQEASLKYINKVIEVSGTISSAEKGEGTAWNIALDTGSDFAKILCTFSSVGDASQLQSGKEVVLRGECSGYLMDVLLNNCQIIK